MHDSFIMFASAIWMHLGLPKLTWIQADIGEYLQHGPRRRIIEAFRGVGKSWITAAYVLWLLYRDPQQKIMVVSASQKRADDFSIFCKRLISDVEFLRFLEPRDEQRTSNVSFDVGPARPDQSPSVKSVGITGQLTGSRADTIVADDIEVPSNSATEQQREKLGDLVKEFDAVLKPGGQVVYLGTPQVEQSLYNDLADRGYEVRVWPARFTNGFVDGIDKYHGRLAPIITQMLGKRPELAGTTTEPARFSDMDLAERETSYGRSGFALQFMLDTSLSDALKYPLRISDLLCMDVDPTNGPVQMSWASGPQQVVEHIPNVGLNGDRLHRPMWVSSEDFVPYQGCSMHIDPSGTGEDETAYAVIKQLNSMLYLIAWGGLEGGYDRDTLEALAKIAKKHGVNHIGVEKNFGAGMYQALFEPVLASIYPCHVEEYTVTGQKERRIIDKLEPVLNQHRLVIDSRVALQNSDAERTAKTGLYQLSHITKDRQSLRHDDRVDVLAEAVGYWQSRLRVDTEQQEDARKAKLLAEELARHASVCRAGGVFSNTVGKARRRGRRR
ncbi:MAG: phage terminase large subunit [Planctomycetota bacterium]